MLKRYRWDQKIDRQLIMSKQSVEKLTNTTTNESATIVRDGKWNTEYRILTLGM